jgi:hypothetical protein
MSDPTAEAKPDPLSVLERRVAALEKRLSSLERSTLKIARYLKSLVDALEAKGIGIVAEPEGGFGLPDTAEGRDEADQIDDMDTPDTVGGLDDDED